MDLGNAWSARFKAQNSYLNWAKSPFSRAQWRENARIGFSAWVLRLVTHKQIKQIRTKEKHMNTLEMKGNWNIAKGKMKQKYAQLTDDDLRFVDGTEDELVGRIQKRTGESKEAIEKALNDCFKS
jgi:uncharacterized protein YjbJ (UPF0337 family)